MSSSACAIYQPKLLQVKRVEESPKFSIIIDDKGMHVF